MLDSSSGLDSVLLEEVRKIPYNSSSFVTPILDKESGLLFYIKRIRTNSHEFEVLAALDHPRLPHIKRLAEVDGVIHVLLPYKGERLDYIMNTPGFCEDPRFSILNLCNAFKDLGLALEYLHSVQVNRPKAVFSTQEKMYVAHGDVALRNITAMFYSTNLFLSLIDLDRVIFLEDNTSDYCISIQNQDWFNLAFEFVNIVLKRLYNNSEFWQSKLYWDLIKLKLLRSIPKEVFYSAIRDLENSKYMKN